MGIAEELGQAKRHVDGQFSPAVEQVQHRARGDLQLLGEPIRRDAEGLDEFLPRETDP